MKQRSVEKNTPKMATHVFRRRHTPERRVTTVNPLTWKLFLFLVSIPLGALYIGYAIGNYMMPPPPKFPDRGVVVDIGRLNYSWYNSHNITVSFIGGLGNHMFQYASMYGIGKANGLKPLIPLDNRLFDIFPLLRAKLILNEKHLRDSSVFNEFNPATFDGRTFSLNFMKNIHLEGFYQSWRYFDHARSDIRRQFRFRPEVEQAVADALREIGHSYGEHADAKIVAANGVPVQYVGVHIRRGDLLEQYNLDQGYSTADAVYLDRAIHFYDVTYKNVVYVVCTDDVDWARENVKTKSPTSLIVLSPFLHRNPGYDLCLLSFCNHSIITVGTFGWWGAWLAAGDVIYYKNFPEPSSYLAKQFSPTDYYPPRW
ncbi:hypothetical protein LSH36_122g04011, partial [Paralvinella palmiformis]